MERGARHGFMNDANPPNIDQRLDRLTERHEALTQTVELIAAAQLKNDERLQQVTADIAKLAALMSQTDKFINRLAHIAEAHEQRLDHLEGQ
jgi:septal ring factor EnvC (AmiA/AmiB activator)